jgi:hypothetical protein
MEAKDYELPMYRLPRGCGNEKDQERATCLDLPLMEDEALMAERGRLETLILTDSDVLGKELFIPRLGLPTVADWAVNRCLLIDGLLRTHAFFGSAVFVPGHASVAIPAVPRPVTVASHTSTGQPPECSTPIWLPIENPYERIKP